MWKEIGSNYIRKNKLDQTLRVFLKTILPTAKNQNRKSKK